MHLSRSAPSYQRHFWNAVSVGVVLAQPASDTENKLAAMSLLMAALPYAWGNQPGDH